MGLLRQFAVVVLLVIGAVTIVSFIPVNPEVSILSNNQDTLKQDYLLLRGVVNEMKIGDSDHSTPLDSVQIMVYVSDTKFCVGKYMTNRKGKCEFKVRLHAKYDITVSKEGYVSKYIRVNTDFNKSAVPEKKQKTTYDFPFAVDIFAVVKGLDVTVLEKPIAKIEFNYHSFNFEYDANYTGKINSELRKMYKDYYLLLKIAADSGKTTVDTKPECKSGTSRSKGSSKKK